MEFCTHLSGLVPDARQAEVLRGTAKRGALNCATAVGEEYGHGGEGGASGMAPRGLACDFCELDKTAEC